MSLIRRVPKHGFTNIFRKEYSIVNLKSLGDMIVAGTITPQTSGRCRLGQAQVVTDQDPWKRRPYESDCCAGAQVQ